MRKRRPETINTSGLTPFKAEDVDGPLVRFSGMTTPEQLQKLDSLPRGNRSVHLRRAITVYLAWWEKYGEDYL